MERRCCRRVEHPARGGTYFEGPLKQYDFQEPYLRSVLGLIGIDDLELVRIEGVGMGDEAVRSALDAAEAKPDYVVDSTASAHTLEVMDVAA